VEIPGFKNVTSTLVGAHVADLRLIDPAACAEAGATTETALKAILKTITIENARDKYRFALTILLNKPHSIQTPILSPQWSGKTGTKQRGWKQIPETCQGKNVSRETVP